MELLIDEIDLIVTSPITKTTFIKSESLKKTVKNKQMDLINFIVYIEVIRISIKNYLITKEKSIFLVKKKLVYFLQSSRVDVLRMIFI